VLPRPLPARRAAASAPIAGRWPVVAGVLVVSGGVVGWLGRRARAHYRRLSEGELAVGRQLEDAERVKDDLVAIVSHELRTPLTSIRGYARTLLVHGDRLTAEEREEFIEKIDAQSARLSRLVENLLLASRASHADLEATADVGRVVADALQELRTAWGESQAVEIRGREGVWVEMSPEALHQVVLNLVANAVKFNHSPDPVGVLVEVAGDEVTLEVCNAAHPVGEGDRERMFQPFVQLDQVDQHAGGLGLGLYIVRRLVEAHRGSVEALTEAGQMRLRVRLRRADAATTSAAG
jgi:signal transduction histidine kinase